MKNGFKNERGVTLISLAVAIIILGIITSLMIYNVKDEKDIERITSLYSDIDQIKSRISNYYSKYGSLPVLRNIDLSSEATINDWINLGAEGPLGANDTGSFYVINLKALENLSLYYGKDFSKITDNSLQGNDIYVINENSHNVFYLQGVRIKSNEGSKLYYTEQERDTEKVDIRYIDGIKIPSGFSYKSGQTKNDLEITEITSNDVYKWANTSDGNYNMIKSGDNYYLRDSSNLDSQIVLLTGQAIEDLIEAAREAGGFYYKLGSEENTINVIYMSVLEDDNWGVAYNNTGIYTDKNGEKAYIPKGFKVSRLSTLNTIEKGLVIKNDSTGDEYVWIRVPKRILDNARTLEQIEDALKEYTKDYRQEGYEDTWYDGCGLTEIQYNKLKNKMLQSIKTNGGFYIGRYEAGTNTARIAGDEGETAEVISQTNDYGNPLSQKDKYPYNYVTVNQAQGLSELVKPTGTDYETSLMFGLQWDLVCKFLEELGAKNHSEIAEDSTTWGNYSDSQITFDEVPRENRKLTLVSNYGTWLAITKGFNKESGTDLLYTTGASEKTKTLNIYDLAGNEMEFTLERNNSNCVVRGNAIAQDSEKAMSSREAILYSDKDSKYGFRVTLFK